MTTNESYTFSDVLITPKYSEILSRKNVIISTNLADINLTLPVFAANMKTICGSKMAIEIYRAGGMGILHRFNTTDEGVQDFKNTLMGIALITTLDTERLTKTCAVSIGVKDPDKERYDKLYEAGARIFCVDVAHGHHLLVKNMIRWIRSSKNNDVTIIAGNIATAEAAMDLTEWGTNIVKVGIGPGCFTPEMPVNTKNGLKEIKNIKNGDYVFTHLGRLKKVINTIKYKISEKLIKINNIICTKKHKFYVILKKDKNQINSTNLHQFARWIPAENLSKDYLLIKILHEQQDKKHSRFT